MMKKNIVRFLCIFLGLFLLLVIAFRLVSEKKIVCSQETKECPDGTLVSRLPPSCNFSLCPGEEIGILVSSPQPQAQISSPLKITGQARGFWYFEAQFKAEIYDSDNNLLGQTILRATSDWTTTDFVPFAGELTFTPTKATKGVLRFLSDNPSGLPEKQKIFEVPVKFQQVPLRTVSLYYYNSVQDQDETGNILCSKKGLVEIKREIPNTKTPIQDTINLLLKGKANLTPQEIAQGITTEFPLTGFTLKEANLKSDGTLILKFDDPLNQTSGGACRTGLLWFQIEETAKQFPEVKKVEFLPSTLFQP